MGLRAIMVRLSTGPRFGRLDADFRSACVDPEERLAGLAHSDPGEAHLIWISHDPRTRIGAHLRRTTLDEFLPHTVPVVLRGGGV